MVMMLLLLPPPLLREVVVVSVAVVLAVVAMVALLVLLLANVLQLLRSDLASLFLCSQRRVYFPGFLRVVDPDRYMAAENALVDKKPPEKCVAWPRH